MKNFDLCRRLKEQQKLTLLQSQKCAPASGTASAFECSTDYKNLEFYKRIGEKNAGD
jgi:hypothetical protein